ncbi:hypothetical protein E1A91_A06G058900v1 [Gossypium mustelinum]|uniref:Uncharacterized protein n=3 Tax=Gossypium TaxID=3633 RepID=A0A5D2YTL9_GOSMU|nr:hypothetical protein ES288_A06G066200v1 [Gossypium darwinii]TYI21831.1 hypothetical protein ES332_A06G064800v1 [Gossypium tomentosum]TYJ29279.1 hypothetical protein E1A91_A06G058900v1 [Gossypium mustelinum]
MIHPLTDSVHLQSTNIASSAPEKNRIHQIITDHRTGIIFDLNFPQPEKKPKLYCLKTCYRFSRKSKSPSGATHLSV